MFISDFTRSGYRNSSVIKQHEKAVFTYGNIIVTPDKTARSRRQNTIPICIYKYEN